MEEEQRERNKDHISENLLRYLRLLSPGADASTPKILLFSYYPMRIALAEWITYTHLMSRFIKHYEYSVQNIEHHLHDKDIEDLQRWRRRSKQSRQKLLLLTIFINEHMQKIPGGDKGRWRTLLQDIKYVSSEILQGGQSMEQILPMATSMVQLLDSRRAIMEAINVRRLTYIALVFAPLSWVASIFSMGETWSPGQPGFWIYLATAIPLLSAVIMLCVIPYDHVAETWKKMRRHNGESPGTERPGVQRNAEAGRAGQVGEV